MNIKRKQSGITFISLMLGLAILAFFVGFGLTLYPLYYEKMQVVSAMKTVSNRPDAAKLSPSQVRKYFLRSIAITNIRRIDDRNVKQFLKVLKGKKGKPNQMHLKYDAKNNFVKDLSLLVEVDEKMPLGK